jgi:hypothetical protein
MRCGDGQARKVPRGQQLQKQPRTGGGDILGTRSGPPETAGFLWFTP